MNHLNVENILFFKIKRAAFKIKNSQKKQNITK